MRALLFAFAALFIAASGTPSMAREYAFCARTPLTSGNPECSYATYDQCRARINGIGGDCIRNPVLAYDQYQGGRGRRSSQGYDQQNDSWDRRW